MSNNAVIVVAVVSIAGLESIALLKGINGTLFAAAIGAIGTIVGYAFGRSTGEKAKNE